MINHDDCELFDNRYLRLKSVLELIPVGRSTWYRWIQYGIAPQPTKISLRVAAWKAKEIKDLLDEMGQPDWGDTIKRKMKSE